MLTDRPASSSAGRGAGIVPWRRQGKPPTAGLPCVRLDRLPPGYDELLASSAQPSIFLGRAWLESWLDVFGDRHAPCFLAVHEGTGLLGLAPFVINSDSPRVGLRRLTIAGQQPTSGEHLTVVASAGQEGPVADAVAQQLTGPLRRRWDVLNIQRMRTDSPMLAPLTEALLARGCAVEIIETGTSPHLPLPADVDEILRNKSKNFRGQVRQSANRLGRLGTVTVALAGEEMELDDAFDHLLRLHRLRWSEASSFDSSDKIAFHRSLSRRLLDDDQLYLAVLLIDGDPIAARYDFVSHGKIWCIQGGWDPVHASARPGMFMTEHVMRWGVERGLGEYDFLAGDGEYKDRWATEARDLVSVVATNPRSPRAQAYRALAKLRARGTKGTADVD